MSDTEDPRIVSIEKAERTAGKRLDRRYRYAIIDGDVCITARWTGSCSGCTEEFESVGSGCQECGYTGKRRNDFWVPLQGWERLHD